MRVSPADDAEDAIAFLQGLLTNDVTGEGPAYAALLTAQGKTMFDMFVWHDGNDVLLDCDSDRAEDLVKRLSLYRLRRKLDIAIDPELGVFWSEEQFDGAAPDPRLPSLGFRRVAHSQDDVESVDAEYTSHRLSHGVPEGFDELGDILWLETNAAELNGVSFTKGCYIGQENTARMNWRSKVNRRLVVVPLDQSQEKRRRAAYPDHGLAVDHLRIDDIPAEYVPAWMTLEQDNKV